MSKYFHKDKFCYDDYKQFICPECGNVLAYNSHFGGFLCQCGYEFITRTEKNQLYHKLPKVMRKPILSTSTPVVTNYDHIRQITDLDIEGMAKYINDNYKFTCRYCAFINTDYCKRNDLHTYTIIDWDKFIKDKSPCITGISKYLMQEYKENEWK